MTSEADIAELRRIAHQQQLQLQDSQQQLGASQRNVESLWSALARLSVPSAPSMTSAPRKKPDLPKFNPKNIEVWLQRVEAAYLRQFRLEVLCTWNLI